MKRLDGYDRLQYLCHYQDRLLVIQLLDVVGHAFDRTTIALKANDLDDTGFFLDAFEAAIGPRECCTIEFFVHFLDDGVEVFVLSVDREQGLRTQMCLIVRMVTLPFFV